jgi:hypothetical protein
LTWLERNVDVETLSPHVFRKPKVRDDKVFLVNERRSKVVHGTHAFLLDLVVELLDVLDSGTFLGNCCVGSSSSIIGWS